MQTDKKGKLYVVATPIGNLQDITLRALEILQQVDKVAAEDTRRAALLLKHFSINKPTISVHEFNERDRGQAIIKNIVSGQSIALVSDAGTPLVSDPGYQLIKMARHALIEVIPIPGPCAAIAALSAAGLPPDRFIFEGFLSHKTEVRKKRLTEMCNETRTIIFYEAPHRMAATLSDMIQVFGEERSAVVAREITKIHESFISGSLQDIQAHYRLHPEERRGEVVILIAGVIKAKNTITNVEISSIHLLKILLKELALKQAVHLTSQITGGRKNVIYKMALTLQNK